MISSTIHLIFVLCNSIFAQSIPEIGGVALYNNCNTVIYSFTVTESGTIYESNGIGLKSWYWEPYINTPVGGVSVKLSRSNSVDNHTPITQLEYSIRDSTLWYDISNVNCGPTSQTSRRECPFLEDGIFLQIDQEACSTRYCPKQDITCLESYNIPTDDWAVKPCQYNNSNLEMFLCSDIALNK
jgi:hypothetical protein